MRVLEGGQADRVAAVMGQLTARQRGDDAGVDVREQLGAGRARHELRPCLVEDVEQDRAGRLRVGVRAGDVRLGGVAPVAAGTHDDVGDHGVALLHGAPPATWIGQHTSAAFGPERRSQTNSIGPP